MNETTTEERKWVDIASGDDVAEGEVKTFTIDAQRIAVARANFKEFAEQIMARY